MIRHIFGQLDGVGDGINFTLMVLGAIILDMIYLRTSHMMKNVPGGKWAKEIG